jgi:glutamine synthetase adenylyltransferase
VKKLKKLVLLKLSEIAAEQQRSYEIALAYENSLFFQTRITEHERLLQHYDSEIKRQDTLFQKVYEGMIENHSITSSDMQELMRYLRRVRDDLHNRISAILREQEDYRQYESTDSEKYKLFIELGGHDGLTSELIESFIKRIDVDLVGVRVII